MYNTQRLLFGVIGDRPLDFPRCVICEPTTRIGIETQFGLCSLPRAPKSRVPAPGVGDIYFAYSAASSDNWPYVLRGDLEGYGVDVKLCGSDKTGDPTGTIFIADDRWSPTGFGRVVRVTFNIGSPGVAVDTETEIRVTVGGFSELLPLYLRRRLAAAIIARSAPVVEAATSKRVVPPGVQETSITRRLFGKSSVVSPATSSGAAAPSHTRREANANPCVCFLSTDRLPSYWPAGIKDHLQKAWTGLDVLGIYDSTMGIKETGSGRLLENRSKAITAIIGMSTVDSPSDVARKIEDVKLVISDGTVVVFADSPEAAAKRAHDVRSAIPKFGVVMGISLTWSPASIGDRIQLPRNMTPPGGRPTLLVYAVGSTTDHLVVGLSSTSLFPGRISVPSEWLRMHADRTCCAYAVFVPPDVALDAATLTSPDERSLAELWCGRPTVAAIVIVLAFVHEGASVVPSYMTTGEPIVALRYSGSAQHNKLVPTANANALDLLRMWAMEPKR
jgi:hypothetical protein